ncbi:sulfate permease [hydrocarbon metagenome]|uniref:Sulfate permease n=1 Tax=hydrocarbon metagenome TaxID=938273 RepID=A0A0W8FKN7_9ZZZZ|nr:hypothetical protein [Methanomicrobiaceae archaeon]
MSRGLPEASSGGERPFRGIRFSIREFAGSVGDFGTIFPIILGAGITAGVNISHAFLFLALWYIIAGLLILAFAVAFAPPEVLTLIPFGIFGGLLIFVGLELGKHAPRPTPIR